MVLLGIKFFKLCLHINHMGRDVRLFALLVALSLSLLLVACGSRTGFIEEELVLEEEGVTEKIEKALPGTGAAVAGESANETPRVVNITITNATNITSSANASTNATLNKTALRNLSIEFLLGLEGSSIFVRTPGDVRLVIDGGTSRDGFHLVKLLWHEKNITRIDHAIATNSLDSSIGGLDSIILNYNMTKVWYPQLPLTSNAFTNIVNYARLVASSYQVINSTIELAVGDSSIKLEALVPFAGGLFNAPEDNSVVLRLVYGDFAALLLSDCASGCQAALAEHHGTRLRAQLVAFDSPISRPLIDLISPEVAVTESGQTLEGVKMYGNGTVTLESDGKSYLVAVS